MNKNLSGEFGHLDGRTYIIGREGHIYIDSPMVSQQHAEIKIVYGKISLRDLNSTNGTYLIKDNKLVPFEKGYVNSLQSIMIGDQIHTIQSLLAIAGNFAATDDSPTLTNLTKWAVDG